MQQVIYNVKIEHKDEKRLDKEAGFIDFSHIK